MLFFSQKEDAPTTEDVSGFVILRNDDFQYPFERGNILSRRIP